MSVKNRSPRKKTEKVQKIHIGKIISKRILSTVFDGSFGKHKCVWKIEHISKKDHDNKESKPWDELNFSLEFGNKHPEHFMKLLHYHFGDCSRVELMMDLDNPPSLWGPKLIQEYKDIVKDDICLHKAYTKMDVILNNVVKKLNLLQIYSMILQINYALKLLHDNGYIHGDFYSANIGAVKTSKSSKKKLGNMTVHTFGYDWKLIDFGLTMHKNNVKSKNDKYMFNRGEESDSSYFHTLSSLIQSPDNNISHEATIDKMKKSLEYESIKGISKNVSVLNSLFMTLFPEKYLSFLNGTGEILQKNILPVGDLIFFAHHGIESEATRDYLFEKIN
jgi:tRNA A-37 threonylcarbamoyl transferase component Bud32